MDPGILQGLSITPLLFLVYTSSLFCKIREIGAHFVGLINDITSYKGSRDIDKSTATFSSQKTRRHHRKAWWCINGYLLPNYEAALHFVCAANI